MQSPPRLILLAGPFGAGKTTLRDYLDITVPVVSTDDFAIQRMSELYLDRAAARKDASMDAHAAAHKYIKDGTSFAWETTWSPTSSNDFNLKYARQRGFEIELLYVGIDSWDLANARVTDRVRKGDLVIPPEHLEAHFNKSINNLALTTKAVTTGALYDNTEYPIITIASIKFGQTYVRKGHDLPEWFDAAAIRPIALEKKDFEESIGNLMVNPGRKYTRKPRPGPSQIPDPDPDPESQGPRQALPDPDPDTTPTTKPAFEPGRTPPQSVRHNHRRGISM